MNETAKVAIRIVLILLFLGLGAFFMLGPAWGGGMGGAYLGVVAGCFFWLLAAILMAPWLAGWLSSRSGGLFFPEDRFDRPQPHYSLAEAKAKRGAFEAAMADYAKMAVEDPAEIRPYFEMIDLALMHLHDRDRAEAVFRQGMETLEQPEPRAALGRYYAAACSRAEARPEWGRVHKVAPRAPEAPETYRTAPDYAHVPNPLRSSGRKAEGDDG